MLGQLSQVGQGTNCATRARAIKHVILTIALCVGINIFPG
jgi:hypothetical protein